MKNTIEKNMKRNRNKVQNTVQLKRAVTKGCVNNPIHEHAACISPAPLQNSRTQRGTRMRYGHVVGRQHMLCFNEGHVAREGAPYRRQGRTATGRGRESSKLVFLWSLTIRNDADDVPRNLTRRWSTWRGFFHWTEVSDEPRVASKHEQLNWFKNWKIW